LHIDGATRAVLNIKIPIHIAFAYPTDLLKDEHISFPYEKLRKERFAVRGCGGLGVGGVTRGFLEIRHNGSVFTCVYRYRKRADRWKGRTRLLKHETAPPLLPSTPSPLYPSPLYPLSTEII
jgi:hypothetical protein